ncbi:hypothetical protein CEXT_720361 [Caerostris extrusa]|uniref:CUE domain-containing protein n=1 Tax=Caerostris extrusa TaxID=172846 RepID=A0AAV4SJ22_CAEEX|nr:hypothetical protein CEXT_720361 [Caerostris extrusa]
MRFTSEQSRFSEKSAALMSSAPRNFTYEELEMLVPLFAPHNNPEISEICIRGSGNCEVAIKSLKRLTTHSK